MYNLHKQCLCLLLNTTFDACLNDTAVMFRKQNVWFGAMSQETNANRHFKNARDPL